MQELSDYSYKEDMKLFKGLELSETWWMAICIRSNYCF